MMTRIYEWMEQMMEYPDHAWYARVINRHPNSCQLTKGEEGELILKSIQTAEQQAAELKMHHEMISGIFLAREMGISVRRVSEELRPPFLYMGQYEPGEHTVVINTGALDAIRTWIEEEHLSLLISAEGLEDLVIYHELFHALEEQHPSLYTRTKMLKRRLFGLLPYTRGLDAAGEVGAIHFSKLVKDMHYSPCVYEMCLLLKSGACSVDFSVLPIR